MSESLVMSVELLPSAPLGPIEAGITIQSGPSSVERAVYVPVEALIVPPVVARPHSVYFGFMRPGSSNVRRTTIYSTTGTPFRITHATSSHEGLLVALEATDPDHIRYALETTLLAPVTPGPVHGSITVLCDRKDHPKLDIPFYGIVVETGASQASSRDRDGKE